MPSYGVEARDVADDARRRASMPERRREGVVARHGAGTVDVHGVRDDGDVCRVASAGRRSRRASTSDSVTTASAASIAAVSTSRVIAVAVRLPSRSLRSCDAGEAQLSSQNPRTS